MKYIDTHCHLSGDFYKSDAIADIKMALLNGVDKVIVPGTDKDDSLKSIKLAEDNMHIFAMAGAHPCDAHSEKSYTFLDKIDPKKIVAVGETGIDLYHTQTNPPLEMQLQAFRAHIAYALKHKKALVVHGRSASREIYEEIKDVKGINVIMHCFTDTWYWAKKFVALGFYISIPGVVTYKNAHDVRDVARKVPLDQLIVETDAPFLTPVPKRGKTNTPAYVKYVADFVASIRDEGDEEVLNMLYSNSLKAFGLGNI